MRHPATLDAPVPFGITYKIGNSITTMIKTPPWKPLLGLALSLAAAASQADEGMWLYNHPPAKLLHDQYGFDLTDSWREHLQQSSVKFGTGGSAEFVSEEGLILSNHHVGSRALQRLSTREHNYLRDGFYAPTRVEEKPCPGAEARVLMSIEDVTARVNAAVPPGLSDDAANRARRAAIAAIEKESLEKTSWRSEVVTLYQGAEYHLYRYRRYTDIRLVFAPEEQIAFYGGDPDNFEYPRFDLDICLFRAYENGQPAHVKHFLKWSKSGPAEGELVFVSGHPGRTDRLRTMAELEYLRDVEYPRTLERLKRQEVLLTAYSTRSAENARRARGDLFGTRNSRKVRDGALAGLLDPKLMSAKQAEEDKLRAAVAGNADLAETRDAWDRIAKAQKEIAERNNEYEMLERNYGFNSVLFTYAQQLLRSTRTRSEPEGERLEEYRESARASLELQLFAENPVYEDLEIVKLADSLTWLTETLGADHSLVRQVLAEKSPRERAAELVHATKLASSALRRQYYQGGKTALDEARDPMVEVARLIDPRARALRREVDARREAIRQAHAQIGKARYSLLGASQYPDATSTLRLAFGVVKGYEEDGHAVPSQTTFAGLYQRAAEQHLRPPFDLPQRWLDRKKKLTLATPFNFVSTADIIGGNSGSPTVNRNGEFVGIIFDGNLQSLTADFLYTDAQCRALSVHAAGIIEALKKVYNAKPLVAELLGK